jgi:hypothetical protein
MTEKDIELEIASTRKELEELRQAIIAPALISGQIHYGLGFLREAVINGNRLQILMEQSRELQIKKLNLKQRKTI